MRKLMIAFVLSATPAFAALQCTLIQDSVAGKANRTFAVENGRSERLELGNRAVLIEQGKRSATFRVFQYFLGEREQYLLHEMTCDVNLNCSAARILKYPKKNDRTVLKISADGGAATAYSGDRPLLKYNGAGRGFVFLLLEGTGTAGEEYGIKVTCE